MKPAQFITLVFLLICFSYAQTAVLQAQYSKADSVSHLIEQLKDTSRNEKNISPSIKRASKWLNTIHDSSLHFQFHYQLGIYNYNQGDYENALNSFESARELLKHEPGDLSQECYILRYLGLSALEISLKSRAISFLEQAILCFESNEFPIKEVERTAFRLFKYLFDFDEFDTAIRLGKRLPELFAKANNPKLDYVELYTSTALCYMYTERLPNAKIYLDKAEKVLRNIPRNGIPLEEVRLRGTQINYLLETTDESYEKLLAYMDEWAADFDHDVATPIERIGFYYRQAGYRAMAYQYEEAMEAADSLVTINSARDEQGRLIVPELQSIRNANYYNLLHAEIAVRLYDETRDTSLLRKSLQSLGDNFEIYNYNRRTLFDMSERKESLDLIYNSVEWGTLMYWESLLAGLISAEDFWALSEKYRTAHLKEFKYARELTSVYQDMDGSLKKKEEKLLDSLYSLQKNKALKENSRATYFKNISQILTELYEYQKQIGKKYPEYYSQRLEQKYPAIPHVQSQLDSHQVLVEFMNGYNSSGVPSCYSFIISSDTFRIERTVSEDLEQTINDYYEKIRTNPLQVENREEMIQSIRELDSLGQNLRKQLLDPLEIYDYSEWIIIPHQYLYYLPVITLPLTDEITNNLSESAHRARIADQHSVQYAYSAQWWIEGREGPRKRMMSGMVLLPNANAEIAELGFSEKKFFQNNSNWKSKHPRQDPPIKEELESADFDLLYIAAHAKYIEEEEETKIFFNRQNPLPSREISKWPLRGKQVILAACEGQLGAKSNAEGMISLSYYLAAAGAYSITGALWEVADQSTEKILSPKKFPQLNMDAKQIQHSIQAYRSQASDIHQHPYFWGGFWTFQQNEGGHDLKNTYSEAHWAWLIGLAVAYLIFIFYLIWKKKI